MFPFVVSLFECIDYKFDVRLSGYVPGDDFSGKQIHYDAEIVPFATGSYISEITGPYEVRSFLVKFLLEMIGAVVACLLMMNERLFSRHAWQLKRSHEPVHSSDTDVDAIITLKDISDLISAKTLLIVGMDLQNEPCNLLILFCTVSGFRGVVLIVSASVNTENLAK